MLLEITFMSVYRIQWDYSVTNQLQISYNKRFQAFYLLALGFYCIEEFFPLEYLRMNQSRRLGKTLNLQALYFILHAATYVEYRYYILPLKLKVVRMLACYAPTDHEVWLLKKPYLIASTRRTTPECSYLGQEAHGCVLCYLIGLTELSKSKAG